MKSILRLLLIPACLAPLAGGFHAAAAADFPPVTEGERALTAVPGEPNAPAVVLFKKGEFLLAGYGVQQGSLASSLRVQVRMKILTEEGKANGEIAIAHNDAYRLHGFQARTVLPDGRVVPVPSDAKFVRKASRSRKSFVTAVAFPSVQVGAILDYQYTLGFDSIFYLEPWFFSEEVPVRYAEVVFKAPSNLEARAWGRTPAQVQMQNETKRNVSGTETRVWAENLPSVPDDPYGPPFRDLAAQMLLLPTAMGGGAYGREPLLESWAKVCELIGEYSYDPARHKDGGVAKRAREIAAAGTPREKALSLYRFVRDGIETDPAVGVDLREGSFLAKVLREEKGDAAEKALLLQAMLAAVKIDSRLVWAADRNRGAIDLELPNPEWFDAVFVAVDLEGKRVFLDPSDRALGFGQLRSGYEGTPALLFDAKKPERISLPESSADQNLRRAEIALALDEKGRLGGTGTLRLTGHHAWEKIDWRDDEAATLKAWGDWLAESYRDFQISEIKALESPDENQVTVTWAMAQREEEVLGDEAEVVPSAPLGPMVQPLVQPVTSRRSAVMFDYPDRDEVELRLSWPEGWNVEGKPREAAVTNAAGTLAVEVQQGERSVVVKRRLDVTRKTLATSQEYEAIRSLFAQTEKSDAQKLLLVRR
jgi:transglutaminase-like putative cysteine protease